MIYFKPSSTVGNAKFQIGNGITQIHPLDLKFAFRVHVESVVTQDETLKQATTDSMIKIIEECIKLDIISQSRMAERIVQEVFYVQSVDCLGINDQEDLQTLIPVNNDCQPSIRKKLILTEDQQIKLVENIRFDFVSVR
jgi:hypothetical protein